ncbi:DUF742 domain-containing protein [Allosalinactinospora lopnorensis]|uniref:DUF742 domain-containing protein n=1 Tax=Allosalinactinospora lopnorensis TaxID=1352348 RepID=UPI000623D185|nr:DUF742 domain-containing protein [Allosalinactinospora lopnorensis]
MVEDKETASDTRGRLIRPYFLTRGRTRPSRTDFAMTSQVVATPQPEPVELGPEYQSILQKCAGPVSVAEISSHTHLPLGVLRVLLADLLDQGRIVVYESMWQRERPDTGTLSTILDRLRAL